MFIVKSHDRLCVTHVEWGQQSSGSVKCSVMFTYARVHLSMPIARFSDDRSQRAALRAAAKQLRALAMNKFGPPSPTGR